MSYVRNNVAHVSPPPTSSYETKELSAATWPDFERLYSRGNGWDHCWCVAFQLADRPRTRTRAEAGILNHRYKQELLDQGQAHGIVVYAEAEPVGWCQFGPRSELPVSSDPHEAAGWRVTCFVVDRRYRRRGIAGVALRAALDAIRRRGGGVVEAEPIAAWTHGPTGTDHPVWVDDLGVVAPAHGSFGNVSTSGTVSMFAKEGFQPVSVVDGRASARVRAMGADGYRVKMRKVM
jgi:GNAT superfamily N-acetyltransferase